MEDQRVAKFGVLTGHILVLFKLFSIGDSFKFNATRETRLI